MVRCWWLEMCHNRWKIYSVSTVRHKTRFRISVANVPVRLARNNFSIESLKLSLFKKLNMTYVHQQVPCFYDGGVVPMCGATRPPWLYWLANTDMGLSVLILSPAIILRPTSWDTWSAWRTRTSHWCTAWSHWSVISRSTWAASSHLLI